MLNMTADPETHTKRTPSTFQFLKRKHRYDCFTCSSDMQVQSLKTENAAIAKSENTCHTLCTAVAIPYLSAVAADQEMGKKINSGKSENTCQEFRLSPPLHSMSQPEKGRVSP